jgi:hypothetical protein
LAGTPQVFVGQFPAQIVEHTPTSITVVAPGDLSNLWNVPNLLGGPYWPIKVLINGVKARNTLSIESHDVG